MIVISLVLVVISAISLLVGGLLRDDLILIWVSIGAALAAALFLALGVLRGTRRRKPTKAATLPGEDAAGKPATWQGAGWSGAAPAEGLERDEEVATFVEGTTEPPSSAEATTRLDDAAFAPPRSAAAEETTRLDSPEPQAPAPAPKPVPPKPPPGGPVAGPAGGWAPPAPPKPATPPPPVPPPPGG